MLLRGALSVALAVVMSTSCGSQSRTTRTASPRCRTTGDLRLVYTGAAGEGGGDVFGLTGDGHVRRLTSDGGSFDPAFSPDGERIVFSSIGKDGSANGDTGISGLDLYVMADDGSARHRLLDGDEDGMPAWSPDGKEIAFVRGVDSDHSRVLVVGADSPAATRALSAPGAGAYDSDPAWSPDGASIVFVRTIPGKDPRSPGQYRLIVVDADGSNARTVLERDVPLASPSWNPDADEIAFTLGPVGEQSGSLGVVDLDDGAVQVVPGPVRAPQWSMNGRLYGYARNPAVDDFSGGWRVAEFEATDRDVSKGRTVSRIDPIGYLYGPVGVDVPRCDGAASAALTSEADIPDSLTVADPVTAKHTVVMTRKEFLESDEFPDGGAEPETKLVHKAALDEVLELSRLSMGSGDLVWVAAYLHDGYGGAAVLADARTGNFLGSGGMGMTEEQWAALDDLAP